MAITIRGWNDIPEGCVQEEYLHLGPLWLRFLARIKIIERFAYPIAVKKGLVKRWKITPDADDPKSYWEDGVEYLGGEWPGIGIGGAIEFEMKRSRFPIPFFILRIIGTIRLFVTVFSLIIGGIASTRWGRNRKGEYMKKLIQESKVNK